MSTQSLPAQVHVYHGSGLYLGVMPHEEPDEAELASMPIGRGGSEYQLVELWGGPFSGEQRIILTTGLTLWPVATGRLGAAEADGT